MAVFPVGGAGAVGVGGVGGVGSGGVLAVFPVGGVGGGSGGVAMAMKGRQRRKERGREIFIVIVSSEGRIFVFAEKGSKIYESKHSASSKQNRTTRSMHLQLKEKRTQHIVFSSQSLYAVCTSLRRSRIKGQ